MTPKIFVGLAAALALPYQALAGDWQYCLAPANAERKVYISAPFAASGSLAAAESAFEEMLDRAGLRHDDVQCPRADDERSIARMRQYAITTNRELGRTIVRLPLEAIR
jgi:hypothetical protein